MGHEVGLLDGLAEALDRGENFHNLHYRKNKDAKEMKGFWRVVLAKCDSDVACSAKTLKEFLTVISLIWKGQQVRFWELINDKSRIYRRSPCSSVT